MKGVVIVAVLATFLLSLADSKRTRHAKRDDDDDDADLFFTECPNFGTTSNVDFTQVAGNWVTLNSTLPFIECYMLTLSANGEDSVEVVQGVMDEGKPLVERTTCPIRESSVCAVEDYKDADHTNTVTINAADPDRYLIATFCTEYPSGKIGHNWTDVYIREGVDLTSSEEERIREILESGGFDPDNMNWVHLNSCDYDWSIM